MPAVERLFKITERGSSVGQEIRGGVVTFFTMAYIVVLNPLILGYATDIDGKYFVKERVALAKANPGGFWQDYKFTNPTTKKIEPKAMYCEKLDDSVVCGGIYK